MGEVLERRETQGIIWERPWQRRTLLLALGVAMVAGIISLVIPKTYRAEAKILPHVPHPSTSSLAGLAASAGLGDLLGGEFGSIENPVLTYPEILTSTQLLERVALTEFQPGPTGPGRSVMAALKIRGNDRLSLDKAVRTLTKITGVDARLRSGLISVTAIAPDSVLAAFIVQRMLVELDRFNLDSRASLERATRVFVEQRRDEAHKELEAKEQALERFRETNLRIGNSPQLQLELARLEREVVMQSDLYSLLAREYEKARIEEKRDTPTFSIVDPPRPPVRKYRPSVTLNVMIAFLGVIGGRVLSALRWGEGSSPPLGTAVT